jgi:hypothetical protein
VIVGRVEPSQIVDVTEKDRYPSMGRIRDQLSKLSEESKHVVARHVVARLDPEALRRAQRHGVVYAAKYSEDQPRDDDGKWTSGGGGGSISDGRPEAGGGGARARDSDDPYEGGHPDPYVAGIRSSFPESYEDFDGVYTELQAVAPGHIISWDESPDSAILPIIAANGGEYATKGLTLVKGTPQECHSNVARLYLDGKVEKFATGYANKHGLWFRHSWGLDAQDRIVETTTPFNRYYGAALRPIVARIYANRQIGRSDDG